MSIPTLYQSIHGMIKIDELIDIKHLNHHQLSVLDTTIENVLEFYEMMGITDSIYYDPNGFYQFCYWDGFFYHKFPTLKVALLKQMNEPLYYQQQKGKFDKLRESQDWSTIIEMSDKKVALQVFQNLRHVIPEEEQKEIFLESYIRNEYGFPELNQAMVHEVLNLPTPEKYQLKDYNTSDGYCYIFRGATSFSTPYKQAYSWTLDPDTARFFATRFAKYSSLDAMVHCGRVDVEKVKAYIAEREEFEVIVFPEDVEVFSNIPL